MSMTIFKVTCKIFYFKILIIYYNKTLKYLN